jgi:integrase
LVGLLVVTGMRVRELINLDDADVDLDEAVLVIRHAKFDKTRQLFVHPSTVETLGAYRRARRQHQPAPSTPAFLVSTKGTRLEYSNVLRVFHQLLDDAGLARQRHGNRVDLDARSISAFLDHLEQERGSTVRTRNVGRAPAG